jgi:8-oxo-dGTP pyrophosphatase MutT (NUDIX family)
VKTEKISIEQAKPDKLFYNVANFIPVRPDGRALILKRSEHEPVFPGKWTAIGGKMEHADFDTAKPDRVDGEVLVFTDPLLKVLGREAFHEAGVEVEPPLIYIKNNLIIRPDGIPVNLMTFAARYPGGEVKIDENDFTDAAWVNAQEVDTYDCIKGVQDEVKMAIKALANV